ncbi:MAG: TonB-dependent receptor [Candidatus Marinimicrobia bacterium]|nr:TonB-dependent receptor [Candidatus Neomarinimicrobiota bacterium]
MNYNKIVLKSIKKILIILIPIILSFSYLLRAASGKIVGKVVDAKTGESLIGANIVILGEDRGAATDKEGDYYILNLQPGVYKVRASVIGYKQVTKTEVNVDINHTTRVDFRLTSEALEAGESIEVVAEKPIIEVDNTSSRQIMESAEITARPVAQLSDMMTSIPGIDFNPEGELTVRMGTLDQVSFLIDGMRARNPLNSQPYYNVNLMSIQELEVITGGFDAEYGEAQSGVFNIITKEGTDNYSGTIEFRWTPPGEYHWGTPLYDYSTTRYWENTHARHLQWWIDHPDMWVDPQGRKGNDPNCSWTPEESYQHYMDTHQPLTDYTERSSYQTEFALGGPTPFDNLNFFVSGRYRTAPPITGNSYREMGNWIDGTFKLTYNFEGNKRLLFSGYYNEVNSCHGMEWMGFEGDYGNKYAYNDFQGYPEQSRNGQTLKFVNNIKSNTYYELSLSRVFSYESQSKFPSDTADWTTSDIRKDYLRAYDSTGTPIPNAWNETYGLHYMGYWYRKEDYNSEYNLEGKITSQINKNWQMKGGFGLTYYHFDRFQEARAWDAVEDRIYNPYQGNIFWQNKLEFEGLIMNVGLRWDFYNPNDKIYLDTYDPFDVIAAEEEGREPDPETKETYTFGQISPRIGISHPITERSVLHFNYGHFFQRANFGGYGEGEDTYSILSTYIIDPETGINEPRNLGNRELRPRKTVAYELGIEQDFGPFMGDVTAFYKDRTDLVRSVTVIMDNGHQYKTSGNSDYADAKGVEISLRRPIRGFWGGYLTYTWETGIRGMSGDPNTLYPPDATMQASQEHQIGDRLAYMRPNLSANLTFITPSDISLLGGVLANLQIAMDYYVSYPHSQISSDVFQDVINIERPPNRNANIRIRKEIELTDSFRPAFFIEMQNAFNNKWHNTDLMEGDVTAQDRARYINSNLEVYPERTPNNAPFPDYNSYTNLPRKITFGLSLIFE